MTRPLTRARFVRLTAALAFLVAAPACGEAQPAPVGVVERVYFADAHDTDIEVEPGEKFAVALPKETKVRKLVARAPRRARVDGEVLTLAEMGAIPDEWVESAGGPGTAYVFEVLEAGRSKVIVFDAARRERFRLIVRSGGVGPEPGKGQIKKPTVTRNPFEGQAKPIEAKRTENGAVVPAQTTGRPRVVEPLDAKRVPKADSPKADAPKIQ